MRAICKTCGLGRDWRAQRGVLLKSLRCLECHGELAQLSGEAENVVERFRVALQAIRDQAEPQDPTGTWARDVAAKVLKGVRAP